MVHALVVHVTLEYVLTPRVDGITLVHIQFRKTVNAC
jgi:hypothetical protein